MNMQKIVPNLWFDQNAKEAVEFYTSIFPNSKIISNVILNDTPPGDTQVITFSLSGLTFMAFTGRPDLAFNPSVSFMINFDPSRNNYAREELDQIWEKLAMGGNVLMPLQEYSFSRRYGWIQDKYGLSWQLILTDPEGDERPFIIPSLLFVDDVCGRAEEAGKFYLSVFKESQEGLIARYPSGMEPDIEGTIMFSEFMLESQWFTAADSAQQYDDSKFNEAISFLVRCQSQEEIDYYWEKLSADPQAEQCGWLKDKYGLSWQIAPALLEEMLENGTREQLNRVTKSFLQMKKFDLEQLKNAFNDQG